jgi:hypothetical protein
LNAKTLTLLAFGLLAQTACEKKSAETAIPSPSPSAAENAKTPDNAAVAPSATPTPAESPTAAPAVSPGASESPSASSTATPGTAAIVRPKFANPEVNEYLDKFDTYLTDFRIAYLEMRQGNMTKFQAMIERAKEIQTKGEQIQAQLTPEEQKEFEDYVSSKSEQLGTMTEDR